MFLILGELENGGGIRLKEQASMLLSNNKLAIIIPFKDRFDELLEFVPHIHSFLNNQNILHEIFVINQVINLIFITLLSNSFKTFYIYDLG